MLLLLQTSSLPVDEVPAGVSEAEAAHIVLVVSAAAEVLLLHPCKHAHTFQSYSELCVMDDQRSSSG